MEFEEYKPHGGWMTQHRRHAIFNKVVSTAMALAAFVIYATVATIVESV